MTKHKVSSSLGVTLLIYILISIFIGIVAYFLLFYAVILVAQNTDAYFLYPLPPSMPETNALQYEIFLSLARTACVISSFILGIFSFLLMVKNEVNYIYTIIQGVIAFQNSGHPSALPIVERGELGTLAKSINHMTNKIYSNRLLEDSLRKENQNIILALAHDIRTPLTSVMSYLELAKENKYQTPQELDKYISTAYQKATQIKNLTNCLFDYCTELPNALETANETIDARLLAQQFIYENESYLRELGYTVETINTIEAPAEILINLMLLQRVFENILSNISKYANPAMAITFTFLVENNCFTFVTSNHIKEIDCAEKNGIGLKSSIELLKIYSGKLAYKKSKDVFILTMEIPILEKFF